MHCKSKVLFLFSFQVHGVRGDVDVEPGPVAVGADLGALGPGDAAEGALGGVERGVVDGLQDPAGSAHHVVKEAVPLVVRGGGGGELPFELGCGEAPVLRQIALALGAAGLGPVGREVGREPLRALEDRMALSPLGVGGGASESLSGIRLRRRGTALLRAGLLGRRRIREDWPQGRDGLCWRRGGRTGRGRRFAPHAEEEAHHPADGQRRGAEQHRQKT